MKELKFRAIERIPFTSHFKPRLATLFDAPSTSGQWIYEIKFDGYRALAFLKNAL